MAQLAQLGVGGVLNDIVGSDKDAEEGDSEEDVEEDGEEDQIMTKIQDSPCFFLCLAQCSKSEIEPGNGLTYTCFHTLYMAFTHPIWHSHTHAAAAIDKSPTAQDFTDITEVAEDEGEVTLTATPTGESSSQSGGDVERLYQKGISFAQSQLAGEKECAPHIYFCVS